MVPQPRATNPGDKSSQVKARQGKISGKVSDDVEGGSSSTAEPPIAGAISDAAPPIAAAELSVCQDRIYMRIYQSRKYLGL